MEFDFLVLSGDSRPLLTFALKQIARVSPSSSIFSSRLNNFKHKLLILFLKLASYVSDLEELMRHDCRFSLYCNCIRR